MAGYTAIALVVGLVMLVVFATYGDNQGHPGDEALITNFLSHEGRFDELVQMLAADNRGSAAKGTTAIDLAAVARLDNSAGRFGMYRRLLRQISVADLRYFPASGQLILIPDGEENPQRPSRSYLYLPHRQPQMAERYEGYNWRGPGVYVLAGDRPLKGFWFIHHDETMEAAVAPY